jgi:hypothetical protein
MEANVEEMSMAEIRSLEETVTEALAAIRVIYTALQTVFILAKMHA